MILTALMTNREKYQGGEVSGIRVIFPTTKEAMREALKAIGVFFVAMGLLADAIAGGLTSLADVLCGVVFG